MNHIRIPDWQSRGRGFEPDLLQRSIIFGNGLLYPKNGKGDRRY